MPDFSIRKIDTEQRVCWGWASIVKNADGTVVVDHQGDIITPAELQKAAHVFVKDARTGGLMHERTDGIATIVESFVTTPETIEALFPNIAKGLIPTGWCVAFHVTDDGVWKSVRDGSLSAFSIHGTGERVPYEEQS
jgi:hypothetical protein